MGEGEREREREKEREREIKLAQRPQTGLAVTSYLVDGPV